MGWSDIGVPLGAGDIGWLCQNVVQRRGDEDCDAQQNPMGAAMVCGFVALSPDIWLLWGRKSSCECWMQGILHKSFGGTFCPNQLSRFPKAPECPEREYLQHCFFLTPHNTPTVFISGLARCPKGISAGRSCNVTICYLKGMHETCWFFEGRGHT